MFYSAFFALVLVLLCGCSSTNQSVTSALTPAPFVTGVGCDKVTCTEYWERAQYWIAKHSKWKIQTATAVMIQTYNPSDNTPTYGFTVTKEPTGQEKYYIHMDIVCGGLFGCSPKTIDVGRAFYHYVSTGDDLLLKANNLGGGID